MTGQQFERDCEVAAYQAEKEQANDVGPCHYHQAEYDENGKLTRWCKQCGLYFTHPVHFKAEEAL